MCFANSLVRIVVVYALFLSLTCRLNAERNHTIGLLLPFHEALTGDYSAKAYAPAVPIALEQVKKDGLLPGVNLNYLFNKTECNELVALRQQIWQLNHGVDAFFGPGCYCLNAGRIAAAFNKTMMSYKCREGKLSDKEEYPTVARTSASDVHLTPPLLALLRHFNWKRVAVVVENIDTWRKIREYLIPRLEKSNITITWDRTIDLTEVNPTLKNNITLKESVKDLRQHARIVILLMQLKFVIEYMYFADKEGLVQSGEYVFIGFQMDVNHRYDKVPLKWYFSSFYGDDRLEERMHSFASLLIVEKRQIKNEKYQDFLKEIKDRSRSSPDFNTSYYIGCQNWKNGSCLFWRNNTVPIMHSAFLYDAIYQYAVALNETITNNETLDGVNIINKLKKRTFASIFGFDLMFDENATVLQNYTVLDQQYKDGSSSSCDPEFDPEKPCKIMARLAAFWPDVNSSGGQQVYVQTKDYVKKWANRGEKVPLDRPPCGFRNELCMEKNESNNITKIIISVSTVLVVLLFLLLFNIYRQYRMEKQLHSLLWKIDYAEISYDHRRNSQTSIESGVIGSFMQDTHSNSTDTGKRDYHQTDNLLEDCDDEQTVKFTTVGVFKGNLVAIKKLSKKSVDLTRAVLKELNLMREIRHDNLNPFIGACVEPSNVYIVTNYCSKSSLQDILENEDVKLDHMFILALVYDIVKGMTFLHSSEIKFHGNLKSSNCVIDSRWQLKITDYGLHTFKSKQVKPYSCDHAYYRDLLWKAPEILRSPSLVGKGTPAGDVYSFAIILQEMHTRKGPYSHNDEENRDIVEHVKAMECPPYRPVVPDLIPKLEELRQLMKECWADMPQERPSFSDLKKRVHRMLINNKMKTNILDNMTYMMEKYADNLEELVVERTGQLIEEKRKTDSLLERMLPPSVAEQLKKGKAVEAESFSSVTIYFSDIVSFTELCAESTPLQVVNLLNDLYTLFDEIIREFDVYKVETIGDAYMVVSGLPQRNNNLHASEICCMAIRIRDSVRDFKIRHKPNYKLKLRIGIHSGPVVAGVVGRTMPRYCLFGDTVNTASRLESSGEALSIHISGPTKDILDELGGFSTEARGEISLKGKGSLLTYWLLQADANVPRSPHREMNLPEHLGPKHPGPAGLLIKEFHNSTISLRGSLRGSFRNSPTVYRNGGLSHESPVMVRWKKQEDELLLNGMHS